MMARSSSSLHTACAPGKIILFGEHAVNRGQLALAAAVGLRTTCVVRESREGLWVFRSGQRQVAYSSESLQTLVERLDTALATRDFATITGATAADFFTSSAYVVGRAKAREAAPLEIAFTSDLPIGFGLGSGGAAHVALAVAVAHSGASAAVLPGAAEISAWALAGDRIAHGGVASGLDTQTSLVGGVIEYRDGEVGRPLPVPAGLRVVIGNTGIAKGTTGSVNGRVRRWLEEDSARMAIFVEMGGIAQAGREALLAANWAQLGVRMNEAHALLQQIGASHPQLDALCEAARRAGARGAKLTGAGGGGVMIALVEESTQPAVARAIREAGGTPLLTDIGVGGAALVT